MGRQVVALVRCPVCRFHMVDGEDCVMCSLMEPELDMGGCANGCCPDTGEDDL